MIENEQLILQKLENIEKIEERLIAAIDKLVVNFGDFINTTAKKTDETLRWAQEFHRMLIEEYAAGAQGNVFAMVFYNAKGGDRTLLQVVADDMEKALEVSRIKLGTMTKEPTDWMIELVSKQVVPLDRNNEILDKVEEKMKFDRPLDVYVNGLLLAKNKFATTTPQKKAIDGVIENIRKAYQKNGS